MAPTVLSTAEQQALYLAAWQICSNSSHLPSANTTDAIEQLRNLLRARACVTPVPDYFAERLFIGSGLSSGLGLQALPSQQLHCQQSGWTGIDTQSAGVSTITSQGQPSQSFSHQPSVSSSLGKRAGDSISRDKTKSQSARKKNKPSTVASLKNLVGCLNKPGISNEEIKKILIDNLPPQTLAKNIETATKVLNEITQQLVSLENFFKFLGEEKEDKKLKLKTIAYVDSLRQLPELKENTGLGVWSAHVGSTLGRIVALNVHGHAQHPQLVRDFHSVSLENPRTRSRTEPYLSSASQSIANNSWKIPGEKPHYVPTMGFTPQLSNLPSANFITNKVRDWKKIIPQMLLNQETTIALEDSGLETSALPPQSAIVNNPVNLEVGDDDAIEQAMLAVLFENDSTGDRTDEPHQEKTILEQDSALNELTKLTETTALFETETTERLNIENIPANKTANKPMVLEEDSWIENYYTKLNYI